MTWHRIPLASAIALVTALLCSGISACGPASTEGRPLSAKAVETSTTFDFARSTQVSWDRVYVFAPYQDRASIERTLGFAWPDADRSDISATEVCLLVFVKDRKVVLWYDQPEDVYLADIANARGFDPAHAKFKVVRDGFLRLEAQ